MGFHNHPNRPSHRSPLARRRTHPRPNAPRVPNQCRSHRPLRLHNRIPMDSHRSNPLARHSPRLPPSRSRPSASVPVAHRNSRPRPLRPNHHQSSRQHPPPRLAPEPKARLHARPNHQANAPNRPRAPSLLRPSHHSSSLRRNHLPRLHPKIIPKRLERLNRHRHPRRRRILRASPSLSRPPRPNGHACRRRNFLSSPRLDRLANPHNGRPFRSRSFSRPASPEAANGPRVTSSGSSSSQRRLESMSKHARCFSCRFSA